MSTDQIQIIPVLKAVMELDNPFRTPRRRNQRCRLEKVSLGANVAFLTLSKHIRLAKLCRAFVKRLAVRWSSRSRQSPASWRRADLLIVLLREIQRQMHLRRLMIEHNRANSKEIRTMSYGLQFDESSHVNLSSAFAKIICFILSPELAQILLLSMRKIHFHHVSFHRKSPLFARRGVFEEGEV